MRWVVQSMIVSWTGVISSWCDASVGLKQSSHDCRARRAMQRGSRHMIRLANRVIWLFAIAFITPLHAQNLSPALVAALKEQPSVPAVGAVLIKHGRVEDAEVRGVRRNDGSDPVKISDIWIIGSDAKAMTATMIARLVDRGALRWNERLDEMLPDVARQGRLEYRAVTLVQLLSHRAGLPHDIVDQKQLELIGQLNEPTPAKRLAYIRLALKDPPINRPGSTFSYSNTGYLIAAAAAERATGHSYEALMRAEIFTPLGMRSAGIGAPGKGQPSGHVHGHPATQADQNPDVFAPAGNIHLSLADWARFCLDQMGGSRGRGRLLRQHTYEFMQFARPNSEYGLGWGVVSEVGGRTGPALVHAGSDGNWFAEAVLFPQFQSGVLVISNAGESMSGDKADGVVVKMALPDLAPPSPQRKTD